MAHVRQALRLVLVWIEAEQHNPHGQRLCLRGGGGQPSRPRPRTRELQAYSLWALPTSHDPTRPTTCLHALQQPVLNPVNDTHAPSPLPPTTSRAPYATQAPCCACRPAPTPAPLFM